MVRPSPYNCKQCPGTVVLSPFRVRIPLHHFFECGITPGWELLLYCLQLLQCFTTRYFCLQTKLPHVPAEQQAWKGCGMCAHFCCIRVGFRLKQAGDACLCCVALLGLALLHSSQKRDAWVELSLGCTWKEHGRGPTGKGYSHVSSCLLG